MFEVNYMQHHVKVLSHTFSGLDNSIVCGDMAKDTRHCVRSKEIGLEGCRVYLERLVFVQRAIEERV